MCGLPSATTFFILRFRWMWFSLTSLPKLSSSWAAPTLHKYNNLLIRFLKLLSLIVCINNSYITYDYSIANSVTVKMISHVWAIKTLTVPVQFNLSLTTMFFLTRRSQRWRQHNFHDMFSSSVTLQNVSIPTHWWQRLPCKVPTAHHEQFGVQFIAQEHFNMQLGRARIQTGDLPITRWPALPTEPQRNV